jgi:hypothetical protein
MEPSRQPTVGGKILAVATTGRGDSYTFENGDDEADHRRVRAAEAGVESGRVDWC